MWYIIVTCRSLLYALLSTAAVMSVLSAIATPKWLIGKEETSQLYGNKTYRQTIGIYNRCTYINNLVKSKLELNCGIYAKSFMKIDSAAWQACIIFVGAAIVLLACAAALSLLSFCKQICFKKSVLNLAGVMQAIAGMWNSFMLMICTMRVTAMYTGTGRAIFRLPFFTLVIKLEVSFLVSLYVVVHLHSFFIRTSKIYLKLAVLKYSYIFCLKCS